MPWAAGWKGRARWVLQSVFKVRKAQTEAGGPRLSGRNQRTNEEVRWKEGSHRAQWGERRGLLLFSHLQVTELWKTKCLRLAKHFRTGRKQALIPDCQHGVKSGAGVNTCLFLLQACCYALSIRKATHTDTWQASFSTLWFPPAPTRLFLSIHYISPHGTYKESSILSTCSSD